MRLISRPDCQVDKLYSFVIHLDFEPMLYLAIHDCYAGDNLLYNLFSICNVHFNLDTVLGYKLKDNCLYLSCNELYALDKSFKPLNLDNLRNTEK